MKPGYRFGLALSAAFVLLAYKGLAIALLSPLAIFLGWALESASLLALFALTEPLARARRRPARALSGLIFYPAFYVIVVSSLAHTFFFESAAERRFSLLDVDLSTLRFFFQSVLPVRGALWLLALLALIHALAVPVARGTRSVNLRRLALGLLATFGLLFVLLAQRPRVPSPLADMGATVYETLTMPEIRVDPALPLRHDPGLLDKSGSAPLPSGTLGFDKVLVFVMETMTAEAFAREGAALPPNTFVNQARPHLHEYLRYFATNQDSRTGMLSMLGSRFIPYEAYTEAGRDGYMFLAKESSLVDLFARSGFHTAFAVSQQELELVVSDLPWDDTLHLREGEAGQLGDQLLCFVPYEFEHSCEDLALLPRVLSLLDEHPRLFLYQEFIWGHASEYNKASGKTNTEYYSAYLDRVIEHLRSRGTLDRTLIVLTSDHGFRDKGLQTSRAVYELPLWFYAPGFASRKSARLYSHLDFKDLLLHELSPERPAPAENPFVMAVGPTGTSFLTVLTEPGGFLLLKSRDEARYLVHAEGMASKAEAEGEAAGYLRLYDEYVARFAKRGSAALRAGEN